MTIETRAATLADYPLVRAILARAFRTEDEARLWDHVTASDPFMKPEHVRLALAGDQVVACSVILPRSVRTRNGWVQGAEVTLVGCLPEYQGQGYGSAAVRDSVEQLSRSGIAMGMLLGHSTYYPRFGFVPISPGYRSFLPVDKLPAAGDADGLVHLADPISEPDLARLTALYTDSVGNYPCAIGRAADGWSWQLRHPNKLSLAVLPDRAGYALFAPAEQNQQELMLHEAAAESPEAGHRLLRGLAAQARQQGRSRLVLRHPPDHLLSRVAWLRGADRHLSPAVAVMAVVADWQPLLPPGYGVAAADGAEAFSLQHGGGTLLTAGRAGLTQLVLGYRSVDDLLLLPEAGGGDPAADPGALDQLRRDFPALYPHWTLTPFYY